MCVLYGESILFWYYRLSIPYPKMIESRSVLDLRSFYILKCLHRPNDLTTLDQKPKILVSLKTFEA